MQTKVVVSKETVEQVRRKEERAYRLRDAIEKSTRRKVAEHVFSHIRHDLPQAVDENMNKLVELKVQIAQLTQERYRLEHEIATSIAQSLRFEP